MRTDTYGRFISCLVLAALENINHTFTLREQEETHLLFYLWDAKCKPVAYVFEFRIDLVQSMFKIRWAEGALSKLENTDQERSADILNKSLSHNLLDKLTKNTDSR